MPTLTYDGNSLSADGQRLWLAIGAIHYARLPRDLWRDRIAAAKDAGLNCISAPVVWSLHEPRDGQFHFEDDGDLRHFVNLIAEAGMHCILKMGPFVGGDYDFGGLPAWLHGSEGHRKIPMAFRQPNGPFLEAAARYLGKVMSQVEDLQAASPEGGPIVMFQAESEWCCDDAKQSDGYLREIVRYLRENGAAVPITMDNNLWTQVDGVIETWADGGHVAAHLRQLGVVQPAAPRFFMRYALAGQAPEDDLHNLAQAAAAGAQYEIAPFCATRADDDDAPLSIGGARRDAFGALKRLNMFVSQFGHVLSRLDYAQPHAVAAPDHDAAAPSVVHHRGDQGEIVFILKGRKDKTKHIDVLLSDGRTLPVPLGNDRVSWAGININLGGVAELTYCNLRPWAFVDQKLLVVFGPAGSEGMIGIDDAPLTVKVPTGSKPTFVEHEGLTVAVMSTQQADAASIEDGQLVIASSSKPRKRAAPRLTAWQTAQPDPQFKPINSPTSLEALGHEPFGWYRLPIKQRGRSRLVAPGGGDALHLFDDTGKPLAEWDRYAAPANLSAKGDLTVLAAADEKTGGGWDFGLAAGLFRHLYPATTIRLNKPKIVSGIAPNVFELGGCFQGCRAGDRTPADALTWTVDGRGATALLLDIDHFAAPCVVTLNDVHVGAYHPDHTAGRVRIFMDCDDEHVTRGKNKLALHLFGPHDAKKHKTSGIKVYKLNKPVSESGPWQAAPNTPPEADAFDALPPKSEGKPAWFATSFKTTDADQPLMLEIKGMSRGQALLNGRAVGRFTPDKTTTLYLPQPLLSGDNHLLLFDACGKLPRSCKLFYQP